jgi:hypothetical protein
MVLRISRRNFLGLAGLAGAVGVFLAKKPAQAEWRLPRYSPAPNSDHVILNDTLRITSSGVVLENKIYDAGNRMAGKPMILVGEARNVILRNIQLNCNGIAAGGISSWDTESCHFENIHIKYPTVVGIYLIGINYSLMRSSFKNLRVEIRNELMPQCDHAYGVVLDSQDTNVANVCFTKFEETYIDIAKGVAVDIRDGDNILMLNTHCIARSDGMSLRIDKRNDNTFIGFEANLGEVWVPKPEANTIIGWSIANGARPWGQYPRYCAC